VIEIADRQDLTLLVRQYLRDLGFNWEAKAALRPDPYRWHRPPLFTALSLSGHPLQPHLAVPVKRDEDELLDTYERFVTGAIYLRSLYDKDIPLWFGRELGLHQNVTRLIFTPTEEGSKRRSYHFNLVQFAALVSYNVPCHISSTDSEFVVTSRLTGYKFGVKDGYAIVNMRRPYERRARDVFAYGYELVDIVHMDEGVLPMVPSMFDVVKAFLLQPHIMREVGDEWHALNLALNLLWWRRAGVYPKRLLDLTFKDSGVAALRSAVAEARAFEDYDDPLRALHAIFVPHLLSPGRFRRMFGDCYSVGRAVGVTPASRTKWARALDELDPGIERTKEQYD
jgi:hypothetical protein